MINKFQKKQLNILNDIKLIKKKLIYFYQIKKDK